MEGLTDDRWKWAGLVPKWPVQFKGLNLFGCLFNTFTYIEIGGTGGSSFRPMYAGFLRDASEILSKPGLKDVADIFERSGQVWSEIATLALPDSWPTLKKIRELSIEKNKIFEEQERGALQRMRKINDEMDPLMEEAAGELEKEDSSKIFADMKEKILELYEIEEKAFQTLSNAIK
jgi:hypothetical protein